jgi:hypothetical protein
LLCFNSGSLEMCSFCLESSSHNGLLYSFSLRDFPHLFVHCCHLHRLLPPCPWVTSPFACAIFFLDLIIVSSEVLWL